MEDAPGNPNYGEPRPERAVVVAVQVRDVLVRGRRQQNEPCPVVFTGPRCEQAIRDQHVKVRVGVQRAAEDART